MAPGWWPSAPAPQPGFAHPGDSPGAGRAGAAEPLWEFCCYRVRAGERERASGAGEPRLSRSPGVWAPPRLGNGEGRHGRCRRSLWVSGLILGRCGCSSSASRAGRGGVVRDAMERAGTVWTRLQRRGGARGGSARGRGGETWTRRSENGGAAGLEWGKGNICVRWTWCGG